MIASLIILALALVVFGSSCILYYREAHRGLAKPPAWWRRVLAALGVTGILLGVTACGHDNFKDLKGVTNVHPDYIVNIENMDGHPNLGLLCYHGVAFVTTTRSGAGAIHLVPQFDGICKEHEK